LGTLCVATLAVGTVGMLQGRQLWFSTGYGGNEFSSETSSALVLALYVPLSTGVLLRSKARELPDG
jgi:hypothetical protein